MNNVGLAVEIGQVVLVGVWHLLVRRHGGAGDGFCGVWGGRGGGRCLGHDGGRGGEGNGGLRWGWRSRRCIHGGGGFLLRGLVGHLVFGQRGAVETVWSESVADRWRF
jgi:hypothetical protein